jgi:L-malate glycosyltransferase
MVKVCHIISGDLWSGAEVMAFHLLKGLSEYKDLELSAILLNEGRLSKEIQAIDIPVEIVDEKRNTYFKIFLGVRKALKRRPPDVIHSHRYNENILAYLLSGSKKRVKLISTQHGMPGASWDKRSPSHKLISKLNFFLLSKCFQNVVAVSKDVQVTFLNEYGFSRDKVKVIHNGISIPQNIHTKREKDPFLIGSSGRLFPVKDYALMVEVAREVSKIKTNIRFELAGDGPERLRIQDLIKKHGMDGKFVLRGFVNDTPSFYRRLDVYLNTSFHEGIPMSVLEAMAYRIPVIAPKVGGVMEILEDGVEGFLVGSRNPKDFAERCVALYENDSLRKQMGLAARETIIKEFLLEKMAKRYHSLYLDIAGNLKKRKEPIHDC